MAHCWCAYRDKFVPHTPYSHHVYQIEVCTTGVHIGSDEFPLLRTSHGVSCDGDSQLYNNNVSTIAHENSVIIELKWCR